MRPAPRLEAARSYWHTTRAHRYSLLFAMPLLIAYELLEAFVPVRQAGGIVRNGADVLLTTLFVWLLGPRGPLLFMALVIAVAVALIRRDRAGRPLRAATFALMLAESAVLALLFGAVVGTLTVHVVGPLRALSAPGLLPEPAGPLALGAAAVVRMPARLAADSALARLTLSLGAGLYEELLFRVLLVALLANAMRLAGSGRLLAGAVATLVGALLFSAFHYVGPLGEPLRLESFVFRAIAGLVFSALYLARGFGITAWTHALYDIAVLM